MTRPLTPASLSFTGGVPRAPAYDDIYHSADGGLGQARHVFLGGNGLPGRWQDRERFTILETGFGMGVNFLATWQAWRDDPRRCARLHYLAIEKHPFKEPELAVLHGMWPELASLSAALRGAWPPLTPGFHRLLLDEGRVVLTLAFGDIADCLPQVEARADAFYLDGFAPRKNPGMWDPVRLARLNRVAASDATLATYTVAGAVRRALAQGGFACEKRPGFGRKRHMLAAVYAPRWSVPPVARPAERHAMVIGAGIAGSAACERLAARGWRVTLLERQPAPATEASGNLAGIVMPLLSRDDNLPSRLARAAYLFALRLAGQVGGAGIAFDGAACGVLQLARDADHAGIQRATLAEGGYPEDFARWMTPGDVALATGHAGSSGGWLFPQGGWLRPASFCQALLGACGARLEAFFGADVAALRHTGAGWEALDARGEILAAAPVLVIANGALAGTLAQTRGLPLQAVRGQVTHVPARFLPPLPMVVCGDGYVTPPSAGMCCVGASYDLDADPRLRNDSQHGNLEKLSQLLPQAALPATLPLAGKVGFRSVAPDRLPLAGALPDFEARITGSRLRDVPRLPGAYGLLGYASRGLIWAPLAAELLASLLEGEPLPVEAELAAALDPGRFALKAFRRADPT
ncbi:bifunctional tRNA (5-methylaminomethyl-2-thiouridine)(34)-methyltransferase MnmD/FAD-dependent 5-carboxymethylaminomethyl-2-thiouridine(34) oxidoreductase MnmC [Noviherbaspirillum galbum]|uniref:tRNA 5-methylaminomethyl-2-thiouridine biosynthesis bifunctional protein MnmC n=1 Tax=Noviherbaspirillum galbum TaxID=2709383 RepID=A0A6B3SWG8_9BURK|nr:bifunctional tRNA (5-methylaminomethyl-2-thiouridine)(34)-methyltransferase MnmD/FAD-dependent 5-carboxymethylaminomethyl-2-thiouridine(34) oxidoreductase MnmC [Noviherbaspirillum galbum]NEX63785.1 bifunctional tRNA (5-methylaminomethyl-2-thiouridine)(34)-methyltransferase MnmD/FAD-dependent 5-carboxymethylaminomethyl-2-thiouridine(34) oxidoreductase MnmC [Noviherbaspirillum galbum]